MLETGLRADDVTPMLQGKKKEERDSVAKVGLMLKHAGT